jgi:hypothetical protein
MRISTEFTIVPFGDEPVGIAGIHRDLRCRKAILELGLPGFRFSLRFQLNLD